MCGITDPMIVFIMVMCWVDTLTFIENKLYKKEE